MSIIPSLPISHDILFRHKEESEPSDEQRRKTNANARGVWPVEGKNVGHLDL
jgi:hypothetical protein